MNQEATYKDRDLFQGIMQGDTRAFDQLFTEMYPALCYVSRQLGIPEHAAKDLASEVFIQFWDNRANLQHIKEPRAYLYASTRNRCLNYLKYTQASITHHQKAVEEQQQDTGDDILQAIYDQETIRLLKKAVESLPPECRQVVTLGLQGYTTTEISGLLKISLPAVSNQKARAAKLLKQRLPLPVYLFLCLLMH